MNRLARILSLPAILVATAAAQAPAITPLSNQLPLGYVGESYSVSFGTQPAGTYLWSIDAATPIPPAFGLTLNPTTGVLSAAALGPSGTVTFNVQISPVGASSTILASKSYTLRVVRRLVLTTTSLPQAQVGVPYNAAFTTTGGEPPLTWSISGVTFPSNGINFNTTTGAFSGTPTAPGFLYFYAFVSDSAGQQATNLFYIDILPAPLTIPAQTLPEGAVGQPYAATPTATGGSPPYVWSFSFPNGQPPGLAFAPDGAITGTPTAPGAYTINATVTDSPPVGFAASSQSVDRPGGARLAALGNAASTSGSFQIVIHPRLTATTTALPTATRGQAYAAQLQASGGKPPYVWGVDAPGPPFPIAPGVTLSATGALTGTPTQTGNTPFDPWVEDSAAGSAHQIASTSLTLRVFDPVVITTTTLPSVRAGNPYSVTLNATGGEPGPAPGYTWTVTAGALPQGLSLTSGGQLTGAPALPGNYTFQVQAADARAGGARTGTASLTLQVTAPLTVTAPNPLPPATFGVPYNFTLTVSGGTAPYAWTVVSGALPQGLALTPAGVLSGTPRAFGTFTFTLRVTDSAPPLIPAKEPAHAASGHAAQVDQSFTLDVQPSPLNIVTNPQLGSIEDGGLYTLPFEATGGVPPYTWAHTGGTLPSGLTLNPSGVLSGSPSPGRFVFTLRVTDLANQNASREFTLQVNERRRPLEITTVSLPEGNVGRIYAAVFEARGGSRPYVWSITGLPQGLNADRDGGVLGTPARTGTFTVNAQVSDGAGAQTSAPFTLVIRPGTIIIDPSAAPEAVAGTPYRLQASATGGVAPYRFTLSGTAPPGLSFANGLLSGTPTEPGTYTFTIEATDEANQRGQRGYTLVVRPGPLVILTSSAPDGQVGTAYQLGLAASGGIKPYTWSATGSLPPGLSLDPNSGALSGTPTTPGTYQFSAQVSDKNAATASRGFTVVIRAALVISGSLPATGVVGAPLSGGLTVTGGVPPYRWSVITGTPPPGTTFSDGSLSGTPTAAGAFAFSVQVTDSAQATANRAFSIEILGPMTITTQSLPAGTLGSAYSATVGVTGGRAPYAWTASGLPAGLSIGNDGTISGTPTASGAFPVAVSVTDSSDPRLTASRTITLEIGLPQVSNVVIGGIPEAPPPAQQSNVTLTLGAPFPAEIRGTLTLSFAPDAVNNADDPSIQFSTGGRSIPFVIPAGSTQAVFPSSPVGLQTGTVAGTITLTTTLNSGGNPVNCNCPLTRTIRIGRMAPVITAVRLTRTAGGFDVIVTGYSTTREVTQGVFRFGGANLGAGEVPVPLSQVMTQWFTSSGSAPFGGQFVLTMPFTVQGDANSVSSVSVTLTNSAGTSQAVSANF